MKPTEAKFLKRIKTGEYEHEEYAITAIVEDGETAVEALISMKEEVCQAIFGSSIESKLEEVPAKKTTKSKSTNKGKKNAKPSDDEADNSDDENNIDEDSSEEAEGNDGESDSDDETSVSEDSDDSDDSSEDDEAKPVSAKATKNFSGKDSAAKKESGKKSFRKKPQAYNRAIEQHKEIFSSVLRSVAPTWKKDEASKKKAKLTSEKMEGVDFLDENGDVLSSFKEAVKKSMAAKK